MATKVLVIGYGNPGRLDDGLGPACAAAMEQLALPDVTVDADYQLTVEDAAAAAQHDVVVFVDASVSGDEPFAFRPVRPQAEISFSTHSVEPGAVVSMAHAMFGAETRAFALAIRGYEFNEFGERFSAQAKHNLHEATQFLERVIRSDAFDAFVSPDAPTDAEDEPRVVFEVSAADMN